MHGKRAKTLHWQQTLRRSSMIWKDYHHTPCHKYIRPPRKYGLAINMGFRMTYNLTNGASKLTRLQRHEGGEQAAVNVIHWTLRRQLDLLDMKAPKPKGGDEKTGWLGYRGSDVWELRDMNGLKIHQCQCMGAPWGGSRPKWSSSRRTRACSSRWSRGGSWWRCRTPPAWGWGASGDPGPGGAPVVGWGGSVSSWWGMMPVDTNT